MLNDQKTTFGFLQGNFISSCVGFKFTEVFWTIDVVKETRPSTKIQVIYSISLSYKNNVLGKSP